MLYDNDGRELNTVDLVNEFYSLEPVDSLAHRYNISEEQVFEVVGGWARAETDGATYQFDFDSTPPTVTRYPNRSNGGELPGDGKPLPLVSIQLWKPYLVMLLILPGNDYPTTRVTTRVHEVVFRG